ncbi:hypothetical protein IC235_17945 [Hymenobacter sp. BT664]|uniref:DUF91 domain-containing protein n=1 Tax=Hymenobacter montanus TaxID=2771359 RepID=A0A927BF76_9BACT|nr:hypothetical protein [Hymenobacter montanus]MBD2769775.1 hypothetical protein [Hymenobacter montanus]
MLLVIPTQNPKQFTQVQAGTFNALAIWERAHIQEWVRQAPEILGEDLLVVSMEFDRFKQSADRLDLLALDRRGNLVVVELKRDGLASYADLQALRYAAMVSTMTIEKLLPYFVHYQQKYVGLADMTAIRAQELIQEFVTQNDTFKELSNRPRIILCSENFSTELTTTVLWLNQTELDISCVRIVPYKVDDKVVVVPTKIIPLQEANQYMVELENKERGKEQQAAQSGRTETFTLLMDNGYLKEGDSIYLSDRLPAYISPEAKASSDENVFRAEILPRQGKLYTVRWALDGQVYSLMNLTQTIFARFHPEGTRPAGMQAGRHWSLKDGRNLVELADEVWAGLQAGESITAEAVN